MPSMQPACMRHGQSSSKVTYCAIDSDVVTSWAFSLEAQALTLCLHTHTRVCPSLDTHRHAHPLAYRYTHMLAHRHIDTQTHGDTGTHREIHRNAHIHSGTYVQEHRYAQTHRHMRSCAHRRTQL